MPAAAVEAVAIPAPDAVGRVITAVVERPMVGRDHFGDWVTYTRTEVWFDDGAALVLAGRDPEVADPFEYDGFDKDGEPIPVD